MTMEQKNNHPNCLCCFHPIKGRIDKKFCNDACRNTYHNMHNQQENCLTRNITGILRKNRSRLRAILNNRQSVCINKAALIENGIQLDYHTHIKTGRKGNTIFFCFDYGFQLLANNNVKIFFQTKQ